VIEVDQEKCIGCKTCEEMCPEVFKIINAPALTLGKGKAVVINPEGCKICDCQKVIDFCPVKAIFWTEEGK